MLADIQSVSPGVYRCVCVLAGGDQGRFVINNRTGEIQLTRPVISQRLTTNFTLNVMVTTPLPIYTFEKNRQRSRRLIYLFLNPPPPPSLQVCQVNDRLKYSVASVLIRVLSENMFPPIFNRTVFKGFIIQSSSPASIVSTYGNQVLQVLVSDRDFSDVRTPAGLSVL